MIKQALFILILSLISLGLHAADKEQLRKEFIQASQDQKLRETFHDRIAEMDLSDPFIQAYLGASKTLLAEVLLNPYTKYTNFKEGTALIDKAINAEPKNAELRYLRFLIQVNSPDFLGYNHKKNEDYSIITKAISTAGVEESWMPYFKEFITNNPKAIVDL